MRDVLTYCSDFRQWNACAGYAAELATTLGASLTGLHAGQPLPVMPAAGNVASGLAEWMAEATNEVHCAMLAGREFAAWARGQGVDQTHWQVALGDPRDVLEAAAATADLVVLGTHSRNGMERVWLGSVAEGVLRDLRCSALVVPIGAVDRLHLPVQTGRPAVAEPVA